LSVGTNYSSIWRDGGYPGYGGSGKSSNIELKQVPEVCSWGSCCTIPQLGRCFWRDKLRVSCLDAHHVSCGCFHSLAQLKLSNVGWRYNP